MRLRTDLLNTKLPAIVLASHHHIGLGITRSLGRLGVAVFNVDSSRWSPAFFSKYCTQKYTWDFESESAEDSVRFLNSLTQGIGSPCLLIPTTDVTVTFVANHREQLRGSFLFTVNDPGLAGALCNKKDMQNLALQFGVPVPEAAWPQTRAALAYHFRRSRFPQIVKLSDTRRSGQSKIVVRNSREALDLCDRITESAFRNLIVQDWIPEGPRSDWMFNGYFNERSECLAGFTGRKVRQFPAHMGVTSLGVCQRNTALEQIAIKFLQAVGYQGPVDMDFRYDYRDGRYKLLDVNPRIGGSFEMFVSEEGIDVARAMYLDQTGQAVMHARETEGRKWVVEDIDFLSAFRSYCQGTLRFGDWVESLRDLRDRAFFAWDDPWAALPVLGYDIRNRLARSSPGVSRAPRFEKPSEAEPSSVANPAVSREKA